MVTQPSDGGVFEHLVGLVTALRARGHTVAVAGPVEHEAARLDADIHQLELVRSVSPREDGPALARYARIVRAVGPDVIHAHSSKAGALARIGRVAHPRTPVVYTPHGFAFNGYFESERERTAYRAVERALAPLASRVLCVCEAERRLAASVGPAGRTRTVYNAVAEHTPGPPHPDLVAARERGPVVGAVSQLRPGKGVETLVDAMPALLARHPAVSVAVAGSGPLREQVEAQARSLGVRDSLLLLGQTDGPGPVLDGSDLFVNPSWAESFPLSTLEAMSASVPVVVTDVGGAGEAVQDGRTGLLVPARDPAPLADGLARLLDEPDTAAGLAGAALDEVRTRFTVDRMVDGTTAVYGELTAL